MTREPHRARRLLAHIALGIALAAVACTVVLLIHGGFDVLVVGVRVRANEPFRPSVIALLAILAFVAAADGRNGTHGVLEVSRRILARIDHRLVAGLLAVVVVIVGLMWGARAAGGSDSYGYISEAELWLHGRLDIDQPWVAQMPWPDARFTLSPLGYHPRQTGTTIIPTYSPGLPMLMALAARLAGACAVFWVVPLSGGVLMLATFGMGRRLGSSSAGLAAAWLVATSPPFLFMLVMPMSDVPAAAAWAVAFWCVTGGTARLAALGGLAATVAILIRPNLAPMVSMAALWFVLEAWRAPRADRRRWIWQGTVFVGALVPGVVALAALNQFWNGSPWTSGYGSFGQIFSFGNVSTNVRNYAAWLADVQTPLAFLGIAALLAPVRWLWPTGASRSSIVVVGLFVVAVWAEYCMYLPFDSWPMLRFLLPCWPFLMIGLSVAILRVAGQGVGREAPRARPVVTVAAAFAIVLLGGRGLQLAIERNAFEQQRAETKYPAAAAIVAERTGPNAVVMSGMHSGSLRYYAGRMTMTYSGLAPAWLDRTVAWLDAHGAHPYALLEAAEVKEFKGRFAQASEVGRLRMQPLAVYDGPTRIYLFDLAPASAVPPPVELIVDPTPVAQCVAPAASPTLVFK